MSKNTMSDTNFKIGQHVWFFDAYDNLVNGNIIEFIPVEKTKGVPYLTVREGKYGTRSAKVSACYSSKQECLDAGKTETEAQTAGYIAKIQTAEDLVRFMYETNIHGEFPDYAARKAIQMRAKELMGIELPE